MVLRYVFHYGIVWVEEFTRYIMIWNRVWSINGGWLHFAIPWALQLQVGLLPGYLEVSKGVPSPATPRDF
jgi:hypothetical protein